MKKKTNDKDKCLVYGSIIGYRQWEILFDCETVKLIGLGNGSDYICPRCKSARFDEVSKRKNG